MLKPGDILDKYHIQQLIGQGGMSSVYKAFDRVLNRNVAIKVFAAATAANIYMRERLLRESRVVAKLDHPNIVALYDVGQSDDYLYLVTEFYEGGSLGDYLQRETLTLKQIIDIVIQIASALDFAYQRGVVHRDIKPGNILLDGKGKAALSDFGIAQSLQQDDAVTTEGAIFGTPAYLSPEQAMGQVADHRSDLYSLAVVTYQMLTGRVPFTGDSPFSLLLKHINEPPPPPRQITPSIPPEIENIVLKALSKRPEERYATTLEFSTALASFQSMHLHLEGLRLGFATEQTVSEPPDEEKLPHYREPISYITQEYVPVELELPILYPAIQLAAIRATSGLLVGQEYPLYQETFTFGRAPSSDVVLDDVRASRNHAQIIFQDGKFYLSDLRSSNGTLLNNFRLNPDQRYSLKENDVIQIGGSKFEFHLPWSRWGILVSLLLDKLGEVSDNMLAEIPHEYRQQVLWNYYNENQDAALTYDEYGVLAYEQNARRQQIRSRLQSLVSKQNLGQPLDKLEIQDFMESYFGFLNLDVHLQGQTDFLLGYALDTALAFESTKLPNPLPLLCFRHPKISEQNLDQVRIFLADHFGASTRIALLSIFTTDSNSHLELQQRIFSKIKGAFAYDIIVTTPDEISRVLNARDGFRSLRRLLLSQVDLTTVSPYVTTGPVPANIFFGREDVLRSIADQIHNTSFAIYGGRRIGKSSLLFRLHNSRLPAAGYRTVYHDCSTTPSYATFLASPIRDWKPDIPANPPPDYRSLLEGDKYDKPLVLLLDEADKFVTSERNENWPLFRLLRATANLGKAHFILSGEQALLEVVDDSNSPMFNFVNKLLIGRLDPRAVEELVTTPFNNLEIELVNEQSLVKMIYNFTSGHPNVTQRLCHRLIQRVNSLAARTITEEDVLAVIEDPTFQREDFLSTFWQSASPLEKIITLVLSQDPTLNTMTAIRQRLSDRLQISTKARDVNAALQRLVELRSILKLTSEGYTFAVEAFPRVIKGTITLDDMLEVLIEDYQEQAQ